MCDDMLLARRFVLFFDRSIGICAKSENRNTE
jgi:hypothetical protein